MQLNFMGFPLTEFTIPSPFWRHLSEARTLSFSLLEGTGDGKAPAIFLGAPEWRMPDGNPFKFSPAPQREVCSLQWGEDIAVVTMGGTLYHGDMLRTASGQVRDDSDRFLLHTLAPWFMKHERESSLRRYLTVNGSALPACSLVISGTGEDQRSAYTAFIAKPAGNGAPAESVRTPLLMHDGDLLGLVAEKDGSSRVVRISADRLHKVACGKSLSPEDWQECVCDAQMPLAALVWADKTEKKCVAAGSPDGKGVPHAVCRYADGTLIALASPVYLPGELFRITDTGEVLCIVEGEIQEASRELGDKMVCRFYGIGA